VTCDDLVFPDLEVAPMERRLSAILAADMVGYSRLMEADENGTIERQKAHRRELIDPAIQEHHGRIVKEMGDGMLAEFASVVDAVSCALGIQLAMPTREAAVEETLRIAYRIGINLGDVVVEGDDLFGDGINVAARLEQTSEPGSVCISGTVYDHIEGRNEFVSTFLGERQLKNISRLVRVYRVTASPKLAATLSAMKMSTAPASSVLPDKPSIAVLPFDNMSGDPEQEYFADGIVEEIITVLSRFRHLHVIARNSSFTYKGRTVDIKQVGRELNVGYVVEGSVRRTSDRLRIAGQLIDASTGAHLWADRFDGTMADVFDLQDQVASSVVGAITPKVEEAEIARARRKPTERLDAYDYYLRGLVLFDRTITSRAAIDEALRLFTRAIDRDPEFAIAHARAARCYATRKSNGWMADRSKETSEAIRLARRAVELDRDDAIALSYAGYVLAYVGGDLDASAACIDRALALNPNLAIALGTSSWVKVCLGEPDKAIEHAALAMRLSPLEPRLSAWQFNTALAHFCAGRYEDAVTWAGKSLLHQPNYVSAIRLAAAGHAMSGRLTQARKMIARLREVDPALRLSNLADVLPPFRRPDDRIKYFEALRKAGLPE
jgi:TolB-like protein/class 3 adenylate cyclase/tetratricopeptide (TPR) repeat protein